MEFTDLKVGQKCRIIDLKNINSDYQQKLIALGLLPGTEFTVTRLAPLGDPIEIKVRGVSLSLRKSEANILTINEVR